MNTLTMNTIALTIADLDSVTGGFNIHQSIQAGNADAADGAAAGVALGGLTGVVAGGVAGAGVFSIPGAAAGAAAGTAIGAAVGGGGGWLWGAGRDIGQQLHWWK
jgi:hypothetical protein